MTDTLYTLFGLFIIAHGLVHGIMAFVPEPAEDRARVGTFWRRSWLLGGLGVGRTTIKALIYVLAMLTALAFLVAGLSFFNVLLLGYWRPLTFTATVISLVTLLVFWDRRLALGIVIDLALLAALLLNWPPI